jgi:hypothetical protein
MPELREVFEVTTKQMGEPALDAWREQQERQRKANRNKKVGAFAVAAAIVVVAVAVIVGTRGGQDSTTPANPPTTVNPSDRSAEDAATDFFLAMSDSNENQAISMLAKDANLYGYGLEGIREFRLLMRLNEAIGIEEILDSCEESGSTALSAVVRCTYDFHALGSDEIGRGPYSGSYDEFKVRHDGKILGAFRYMEFAKFSPQMWEPFAEWVSTNYPQDVAAMYKGDLSDYWLTPESIRLWEQHSREYVEAVNQGTA